MKKLKKFVRIRQRKVDNVIVVVFGRGHASISKGSALANKVQRSPQRGESVTLC
jgi:hypothetical protein